MRRYRSLAIAQTVPRRGDVDANLAQHVRLAERAAQEGAHLVLFPELSLTGYELDLARELAFDERDGRLAPLTDLAASLDLTLVVGAPVRLGDDLHIGSFVLAANRSIDLYTKHHLGAFPSDVNPDGPAPPAEATVFTPGDRNPLLTLGDDRAALAVCADVGRAAHAEAAAERGATTYLASMFFPPRYRAAEHGNLRTIAERHRITVAAANFGGPTAGLAAAGCSAVWSDTGTLLVQLEGIGAGLVVALEHETGWTTKVTGHLAE